MFDLYLESSVGADRARAPVELHERMGAEGEVVYAPDADQIGAVVEAVINSGAEACAIGFLFSFRNRVTSNKSQQYCVSVHPLSRSHYHRKCSRSFANTNGLSTTALRCLSATGDGALSAYSGGAISVPARLM